MPPKPAHDQLEFELVRFSTGEVTLELPIDLAGETFWASQAEIANLFGASVATVGKQVAAIYAEDELSREATCRPVPSGADGTERYNLDLILSVGYRVNSAKATAFRQWASRAMRSLMVDGYVIDAARLQADPGSQDGLAAKLRAIRADETNIYDSVRSFFATSAADYDSGSEAAHAFVRQLDEKFAFAVTGEAAADLILDRADHEAPDMGLKHFDGTVPSMDEARIARNYLDRDELYRMHLLCEQFLLTIQSRALREQPTTMIELHRMLDSLLRLNDYPVLSQHKSFHAGRAIRHAQAEYARYIIRVGRTPKAVART